MTRVNNYDELKRDVERIKNIPIVATILDVVCQTTGMGFAAVALVTEDRWIACCVKDDIQFGLKPGGELKVETTICNEIRNNHKPVIIDHVEKDDHFRSHHTPLMYGFQSYISVPIILKNGDFFGTLCAIDPNPAELNNPKVTGMFNLFADLIAFHLQSVELMEQSNLALVDLGKQLTDTTEENRQYHHISNHNLQEPLRKIRLYTNMMVNATDTSDTDKVKQLALKVNAGAQRISMMISDVSNFTDLNNTVDLFEKVNLNKVVDDVCSQLNKELKSHDAALDIQPLPVIEAIPFQMEQLFYHLLDNALKFSRKDVSPVIKILVENKKDEIEIRIQDNGVGIDQSQLANIFTIFSKLQFDGSTEGFGVGLAYCRKIIRNHRGTINVESKPNAGTTFSITLPVSQIHTAPVSELVS